MSSGADGGTSLEVDELADLIPDLTTQEELNEWERRNILAATRWALRSRVLQINDPLSESYARNLHRRMFDRTWRWAGLYRVTEKNIGVAPHHIREELAKLLADARYWIADDSYPVDEMTVRFHHRLVCIHPFPNGNGRHARLMTDIVLKRLAAEPFTWGSGNLTASGETRERYLAALRAADKGELSELSRFVRT